MTFSIPSFTTKVFLVGIFFGALASALNILPTHTLTGHHASVDDFIVHDDVYFDPSAKVIFSKTQLSHVELHGSNHSGSLNTQNYKLCVDSPVRDLTFRWHSSHTDVKHIPKGTHVAMGDTSIDGFQFTVGDGSTYHLVDHTSYSRDTSTSCRLDLPQSSTEGAWESIRWSNCETLDIHVKSHQHIVVANCMFDRGTRKILVHGDGRVTLSGCRFYSSQYGEILIRGAQTMLFNKATIKVRVEGATVHAGNQGPFTLISDGAESSITIKNNLYHGEIVIANVTQCIDNQARIMRFSNLRDYSAYNELNPNVEAFYVGNSLHRLGQEEDFCRVICDQVHSLGALAFHRDCTCQTTTFVGDDQQCHFREDFPIYFHGSEFCIRGTKWNVTDKIHIGDGSLHVEDSHLTFQHHTSSNPLPLLQSTRKNSLWSMKNSVLEHYIVQKVPLSHSHFNTQWNNNTLLFVHQENLGVREMPLLSFSGGNHEWVGNYIGFNLPSHTRLKSLININGVIMGKFIENIYEIIDHRSAQHTILSWENVETLHMIGNMVRGDVSVVINNVTNPLNYDAENVLADGSSLFLSNWSIEYSRQPVQYPQPFTYVPRWMNSSLLTELVHQNGRVSSAHYMENVDDGWVCSENSNGTNAPGCSTPLPSMCLVYEEAKHQNHDYSGVWTFGDLSDAHVKCSLVDVYVFRGYQPKNQQPVYINDPQSKVRNLYVENGVEFPVDFHPHRIVGSAADTNRVVRVQGGKFSLTSATALDHLFVFERPSTVDLHVIFEDVEFSSSRITPSDLFQWESLPNTNASLSTTLIFRGCTFTNMHVNIHHVQSVEFYQCTFQGSSSVRLYRISQSLEFISNRWVVDQIVPADISLPGEEFTFLNNFISTTHSSSSSLVTLRGDLDDYVNMGSNTYQCLNQTCMVGVRVPGGSDTQSGLHRLYSLVGGGSSVFEGVWLRLSALDVDQDQVVREFPEDFAGRFICDDGTLFSCIPTEPLITVAFLVIVGASLLFCSCYCALVNYNQPGRKLKEC